MKRSAEEERQQDETKRQKLDEEKERKLLDTPEVKKAIGQLGNTSEVTKVILNLLKNPPSIKDSKTNLTSIKDVGDLGAAGFKWAGALKLKETQTSDWSTKCGISHWSQENLIKDLEELKNTFSVRVSVNTLYWYY
ncbi:hypothetical protein BT96DRAFT_632458 [Gymnopus androsaceus JB14]|uniref:Uncharacterized protein n=1 Tax=Gymnopus androsaceus JB14 TaxID=1447944 RepID=A0A6A4HPF7_9AGAR|nr:hypothetical protein BT96DRAFT_632458 [Gymnopus androsaceus JB14]